MNNLLEQFKNMKALPIVECGVDVYHIGADADGVFAGGMTNSGLGEYSDLRVEWDDCFSLDEHLQGLCELISEQGE